MTQTASAERRAARRARRTQSPFAGIPFRQIENPYRPFEVITSEQVDQLHEASMHILENIGIVFMDAEALDLWRRLVVDWLRLKSWEWSL